MKILNIVFVAVMLTSCGDDPPLVPTVDVPGEEVIVVPPPVMAAVPLVPPVLEVVFPADPVEVTVVALPTEEVYLYPAPENAAPTGGDGSSYTADAGYDGPGNSENNPRCDAGNGKKTGLFKHGMCQ